MNFVILDADKQKSIAQSAVKIALKDKEYSKLSNLP